MIKPTYGKVLVRVATDADIKDSGIIIPEAIKEAEKQNYVPTFGQVVMKHKDMRTEYSKGDIVYFAPHTGIEINLGDAMLLVLDHKQIVAWEKQPEPDSKIVS